VALAGAAPLKERDDPDFPESLRGDFVGIFAVDFDWGAFGACLAVTGFEDACFADDFSATGLIAAGLVALEAAAFVAGFLAVFAGAFLETGAGFLTTWVLETGLTLRSAFFTAGFLSGAALTGLEGDFPEDFRTGEDLEFFFNGALVKPKSRARKCR
jgi:hypothetical protein